MNIDYARKAAAEAPVFAICGGCGELGLLPAPLGRCYLCGGWIGRDYPMLHSSELRQLQQGYGFGFYGGAQ